MKKSILLSLILICSNCLFAQFDFLVQPIVNSNIDVGWSVTSVDMDNDGDKDFVVVEGGNNKISWYENNNLVFNEHILPAIATPFDAYPADLDGDGDMDIVVASNWEDLVWYQNDGNQNFLKISIPGSTQLSTTSPKSVQAIDLDGDGDLDIVTTVTTLDDYQWFINDGNQNFIYQSGNLISYNVYNAPEEAVSVDLDLDGDLDIVTISYYGEEVVFYENDGNQIFTKHSLTYGIIGYGQDISISDIDEDGDLDIVAATTAGYGITLLENDGNQNFSIERLTSNTTSTNCYTVGVIDINNDCEKDIIYTKNNQMHCFVNTGDNVFIDSVIADTTGFAYSIFIDDIDGDGKEDFVVSTSNTVKWYMNNIIPELTICTAEIIHNSCVNTCQGSIQVNAINGTAPYNFSWSNGSTSQTITGLCSGDYTLTITDFVNNTYIDTITILEPEIIFNDTSTTCLESNGAIGLDLINSNGPYTYIWNNGTTTKGLNNISHGLYYVNISNGFCNMTDSIELLNFGEPVDTTLHLSSCDFLYYNGAFIDSSVIIVDTLATTEGCDSIVSINIQIFNSYSDTVQNIISCDSAMVNGVVYFYDQLLIDSFLTINGCDSIEYINIDVNNSIEGNIQTSQNSGLFLSKVYLIDYNSANQTLTAIDSTTTDILGDFSFDTISNNFYIKAVPEPLYFQSELPTYFQSSSVFQYAQAINCHSEINFSTIQGVNPGGNGFIGGLIGNGAGKNSEIGQPLINLNIVLVDVNNNVVQMTNTNLDGYFYFDSLACDSYKIWIDDVVIDNSLSPLLDLDDLQCSLDELKFIYKDNVLNLFNEALGLKNIVNNDFSTYPNPTSNSFNLNFNQIKSCSIKVKNIQGQVIYLNSNYTSGNEIKCNNWNRGLYLIEILDKNGLSIGIQKLIVR